MMKQFVSYWGIPNNEKCLLLLILLVLLHDFLQNVFIVKNPVQGTDW